MIRIRDGFIELQTSNTSYILAASQDGQMENVYYGAKIQLDDPTPLLNKAHAGFGMDVNRATGDISLGNRCLELNGVNRGDYRRSALVAEMPQGGNTSDFTFKAARLLDAPAPSGGMPQGRMGDETLHLSFADPSGLEVELYYTVFADCNVITKKMRVTNRAAVPIRLTRCLSQQLDLPRTDLDLYTLKGAWSRECNLIKQPLQQGIALFGSNTGSSGNRCNPFFFLADKTATEQAGEVYGFNLLYSGSHEASVEIDTQGQTRVLQGIWSDSFAWPLAPGDSFITPEAALTFSGAGFTGMSHNMHHFVQRHILPPIWRSAPRPVLVNNWEGTYFRFNESKLLGMAKDAAAFGAELFVLDDGWFGRRDSDKAGLGDYDVNRKKLPSGLNGLAKKINALGMDFGLWFEPEMVNADSALFEKHPDWIIKTPGYIPTTGRSQFVLDLCRPEVRQYIIESMGKVLDSANIKYVKWDMNRHIADNFSPALTDQGSFLHRYTLGLYDLFDGIVATRPDILFEGCSSGGNRFDLGVLYYMPQIWTSDDTDAHERQKIQTGTSYGYPLCTMGCHVSAVPNHQTLRTTPLDTRFNTAMFGLLGYELDPRNLTLAEKSDVKEQIAYYKKHRDLMQYGDFYRLKSPFSEKGCRWMVVAPDKSEALVGEYINLITPNTHADPLRLTGLDPDALYKMQVRRQKMNLKTFGGLINFVLPVHINPEGRFVKVADKVYRMDTEDESYRAYGNLLCNAGVKLRQAFSGSGYDEKMRLVTDFASRVYYLRKEN